MSDPVLVRAYNPSHKVSSLSSAVRDARARSTTADAVLPPVSAFAFSDILREAQCAQLQQAIDGIAQIYAKNRLTLSDEYASQIPPLGEVTGASERPHWPRPNLRTALTSVPEGSSGSSGGGSGSRKSKDDKSKDKGKRRGRDLFRFRWRLRSSDESTAESNLRIGMMGRTFPIRVVGPLLETPDTWRSCVARGDSQNAEHGTALWNLRRILATNMPGSFT